MCTSNSIFLVSPTTQTVFYENILSFLPKIFGLICKTYYLLHVITRLLFIFSVSETENINMVINMQQEITVVRLSVYFAKSTLPRQKLKWGKKKKD